MSERERTDADADLEFDFFEDLPTTERTGRQPPPPPKPKRSGRPPIRPRAPGGTPLLRLAALVIGAIALAVVVVFWVTACRGDSAKGSYQTYMGSVGSVVQEANAIGTKLSDVITSRGATLDDIDTQLNGLAQQQSQVVARASGLEPPGSLIAEQQSLLESMQLLESGLVGLQQAFGQVQLASQPETEGATLASQGARLVAGEVVYDDLFRARSQEVMQSDEVTGVAVPELTFLDVPDLVSQESLTAFVQRLTEGGGADGTGNDGEAAPGLHGNGIEAVQVQPSGQTLSQTDENTIAASDQLQFLVSVANSGEFQETQVPVTLVIQFSGGPIRKTQPIDVINPQQTVTVTFADFANITFGESTTLKVSVKPVPGEENTSNNAIEYPVIFTLE